MQVSIVYEAHHCAIKVAIVFLFLFLFSSAFKIDINDAHVKLPSRLFVAFDVWFIT